MSLSNPSACNADENVKLVAGSLWRIRRRNNDPLIAR